MYLVKPKMPVTQETAGLATSGSSSSLNDLRQSNYKNFGRNESEMRSVFGM